MGISSDAIVTGIQSVATSTLGSTRTCSDQKTNISTIGGFGGSLTRDGGLGSVMSGSAVAGLRSNMGLTDWWRGGLVDSGRENLISDKVSCCCSCCCCC